MKVLLLYQLHSRNDRNTIEEHLNSFRKYSTHDIHYFNVLKKIPIYLSKIEYDVIIFHYTYLASERFLEDEEPWLLKTINANLLKGYKIAIPQDEYDHTARLCKFFDQAHVDKVYTCFTNESDIEFAYKRNLKRKIIFEQTWTGYVDEHNAGIIRNDLIELKDRKIDIGYRARKLPAYFGRHGQLKYELVNVFNSYLKNKNLIYDINSTNTNFSNEEKTQVKFGDSWIQFLMSCKAFVGCEGGSSLLDYDGSIKKKVMNLYELFPNISFDELENLCFPDQDFNIKCFALSPRHFECAITKTLQILVEGEYGGVFKPNEHYIPLKKDFSNLDEIMERIKDVDQCQRLVNKAYSDIVLSGNYTYRKFVQDLFASVNINCEIKSSFIYLLVGYGIYQRNYLVKTRGVISDTISVIRKNIYDRTVGSDPKIQKYYRNVKSKIFRN